jgi:8-oxo-dGTP diphosphatase
MALPYKIATLLYCFNERDEILLIERTQEPNRGFWSPCGGKLKMEIGESPFACACREAHEEIGLKIAPSDLHLAGIVSEHGYQGQTHWLMFLFEVNEKIWPWFWKFRGGFFAAHFHCHADSKNDWTLEESITI